MKLTKVEDSTVSYNPTNLTIEGGYDNFSIVPDTYTKVVSYASSTDRTLGSQILTTYAVYVQPSQVADTYVGKVKYTLVHPSTNDTSSYYINFYANGGTGTMSPQKIPANAATTLKANSFIAPTDAIFVGWNTKVDGTGTSYANSEQVTAIAEAGSSINLYAQWRIPITIANAIYMQDVEPKALGCPTTLETGHVYELKDSRDERTYRVTRLADGNCWMLDNLSLDIAAVDLNALKGRTNASDEVLTFLKNGGGTGRYPTAGVIAKTPTGGSWGSSYTVPYIATGNGNGTDFTTEVVTSFGNGSGIAGIHYNYCAASAGNYCYASNAGVDDPEGEETLVDTIYDICPAGWRMPTGSKDGQYYLLYNRLYYANSNGIVTATNSNSYQYRLSTPLSGNGASIISDYGFFWSSSYETTGNMCALVVSSSGIWTSANYARTLGFSVRCLLSSGS